MVNEVLIILVACNALMWISLMVAFVVGSVLVLASRADDATEEVER